MGVINKTTDEINTLLDKLENMPEEGVVGKTPVLETGETTTLPAGSQATSSVVANGTDSNGNPKYKLNFGIPKGADGSGSGGGVADSVQWDNVLNKPTWVNSATKPSYTATEVGALPATTTIPSKTSQLTNDSGFTTTTSFKTINGKSIVGAGNIEISGGSGGGISDAPSDGKTYGRNNNNWIEVEATAVNVNEIWNRVLQSAKAGTKISQEDYNTLLGYAQRGTTLYVSGGGSSVKFDLSYLGSILYLSTSIPGGSDLMYYESVYINPDLSAYYGEGFIHTAQSVTKNTPMDGYAKAESYSAITTEDTINSAIGKLEAGIGSGGSSNDYVISANSILSISPTDDSNTLLTNLGDMTFDALSQAISNGKKVYIKTSNPISKVVIPVNVTKVGSYITMSATIPNSSSIGVDGNSRLVSIILSESNATLKHFSYLNGYTLNSGIDTLDTSSTDDDIKAVLPVSSLPELLALSKLGCRFRMPITQGYLSGGIIDAMFTIAKDDSTQDYVIQISGAAYGLYGSTILGSRIITYTASSNTYEVIG